MQSPAQQSNSVPDAVRDPWPATAETRKSKPAAFRPWLQGLGISVMALASYLLISHFLVQSVRVVGVSMVPTLQNDDHYLLNRWVYYFRSPHRAEVVVIRDPADNGFSVKRVIAEQGDTVYLKDGGVYVNGAKLVEPYLAPGTATFSVGGSKEQLFKCGAGQIFVLGDNRNYSVDSRSYGPVARQNVLGMIIH